MTLLENASDLTAAINGQTYSVRESEVWEFGSLNISYPALVFTIDVGGGNIPAPISDREAGTLRIWFLSKSKTDCLRMRDAIFAKLHKQHTALASAGTLSVEYIAQTHSHVGKVPRTGEYAAFMTYEIIA